MIVVVITRASRIRVRMMVSVLILVALPGVGLACIEQVAELPDGPARAVDLEGDLAVFGSGRVLIVADLKDPSLPVELGRVVMPEGIRAVDLGDRYAYVLLGQSGLRIVDLAEPMMPIVVGSLIPESPGESIELVDIAIVDAIAYVAEWVRGGEFQMARLDVIDVSDPTRPASVGVAERMGVATAIEASVDAVFLANSNNVRVYDVSDPTSPVEVAVSASTMKAVDMDLVGSTLFVLHEWNALLTAFDVADPVNPEVISMVDLGMNSPSGLAVADGLAVAVSWRDGMTTVGVEDPSQPVVTGFLDVVGEPVGVSISGQRAAVAASGGGLGIVDITNAAEPVQVGALDAPGSSDFLTVAGDLAVLSTGWSGGARILDISDQSRPVALAKLPVDPSPGRVVVEGEYAYAMVGHTDERVPGISLISIADPAHPTEVGFAPTIFSPVDLAVQWPYVFVLGSEIGLSGFWVFDVRIPWTPVRVGTWDDLSANHPSSIEVAGDFAYVGKSSCPWAHPMCHSSIQAVNISNPSSPVEGGTAGAPSPRSPAFSDGFLYGMTANGLEIVDCRNPSAPELAFLETIDGPSPYQGGRSMALGDEKAFTTTYQPWNEPFSARLHLFDVNVPAWPRKIGHYEIPGEGMDVGVSGEYIFVAGGDAGLYVYDVSACGLPTPRRSSGRATP